MTDNFGNLNRLWNVLVEDLGYLTRLLQSMTKIIQEEITRESKLVKVLLHLGIDGHCDRWMKLFGGLKRCYDNQWLLNDRYFERCIYVIYIYLIIYMVASPQESTPLRIYPLYLTIQRGLNSKCAGGAKFSEGIGSWGLAIMLFCKCVISVATLL